MEDIIKEEFNMKAQIVNFTLKAAPYLKKSVPIIATGITSVIGAFGEQKKAARIDDMEARIKILEEMIKNK